MSEDAARRASAAVVAGYAVRPMTPDDIGTVAEVHVSTWLSTYRGHLPAGYLDGLHVGQFVHLWRTRLGSPEPGVSHLVGLDLRAEVVALGSAGPSRDESPVAVLELWALNVLPSAQGTGLADLMMERLVGTEPASLWVLDGNVRAEAFYRRHGFARDGAEKQHPPTGTTEVRMVRGQHP